MSILFLFMFLEINGLQMNLQVPDAPGSRP